MKKIISIILVYTLFLPFSVFAEGEDVSYTHLSIANGANSKMFLTYGTGDTSYTKFTDYMGYSTSSIIDDSSTYTPYAIGISENGVSDNVRLLLNNGIWDVGGIPYKIEPQNKAVKLVYYSDSSELSNTELMGQLRSMRSAEIDVDNGFYTNLNFLISSPDGNTTIKAVVTYEDGEKQNCDISILEIPYSSTNRSDGYIVASTAENTAGTSKSGRRFATYSIATDGTKKVDKITLSQTAIWRDVYIISLTAQNSSLESLKYSAQGFINRVVSCDINNDGIASYSDFVRSEYLINTLYEQYGVNPDSFQSINEYNVKKNTLQNTVAEYISGNTFNIYVQTDGSDGACGSETAPFKTINKARDDILYARKNNFKGFPINANIGGGDYAVNDMVCFSEENSGFEGGEITYKAKDGETVNLTGGKKLNGANFTNVDNEVIYYRLPAKSRDRVMQIDLSGQGIGAVSRFMPNANMDDIEDVMVIDRGKAAEVAQWPNNPVNMALAESVISSGSIAQPELVHSGGGSIEIPKEKAQLWQNLTPTESYILGALYQPWRMERILIDNVSTADNSMNFYSGSCMGISDTNWGGIRFKVMHLLEELDTPGEWYIDRNTNILYYYPQGDLNDIEIADGGNMFFFDSLSYVNFHGLSFKNSKGSAVVSSKNLKDVDITGCTFKNIAADAIKINPEIDFSVIGSQVNSAYNLNVSCNDFEYIGRCAYRTSGSGHSGTLTHSNNKFNDNYIYKASMYTLDYAIRCSNIVGDELSHNIIHSLAAGGITFTGNDCLISYNEIYNLGQNFSDVSGIYSGRSYIRRNNEICYNFVHHSRPLTTQLINHHRGIYLDDGSSGQYAHHNIAYNVSYALSQSGKQNRIDANIVAGETICAYTMGVSPYLTENDMLVPLQRVLENKLYKNYWISKYPELLTIANETPYHNKVTNNVSTLDMRIDPSFANVNDINDTFSTNVVLGLNNLSEFEDPVNLDFRIKSGSSVLSGTSGVLSTDNFDINTIGLTRSSLKIFNGETSPFTALVPQNESNVTDSGPLLLKWQDACGADKYKIQIATDKNMQNIIYTKDTDLNYIEVEDIALTSGRYYWSITAFNTSRQLKFMWASENPVYSFNVTPVTVSEDLYNYIDISDKCNAKATIELGQTDTRTDVNGNYMYRFNYVPNLTRLKGALNSNNMVKVNDVWYKLSQINSTYKALLNYNNYQTTYTISVPKSKYEKLYFFAEKNIKDCSGCSVTINYADGSSQSLPLLEKVTNGAILGQVFTGANWLSTGLPRSDWFYAGIYSHPVTPRDTEVISVSINSTSDMSSAFNLYGLTGKIKKDCNVYKSVYTPLSLTNGANSKMFLDWGQSDSQCTKFLDYIGYPSTSEPSDDTPYTNPKAIRISDGLPGLEDAKLVLSNNVWNVSGIPYVINKESKVVKVAGFSSSTLVTDPAVIAAINSLKSATVDVENGNYNKLNLLIGTTNLQQGQVTYVDVSVIYEDGSNASTTLTLLKKPYVSTVQSDGYIVAQDIDTSSASQVDVRFTSQQIAADSAKRVDKIKLSAVGTWRDAYVLSIVGESQVVDPDSFKVNIPITNNSEGDLDLSLICAVKDFSGNLLGISINDKLIPQGQTQVCSFEMPKDENKSFYYYIWKRNTLMPYIDKHCIELN